MGFSAQQLSFCYPGKKVSVFKDFSIEAKDGEVVAILGRNGTGKTTLLRMLAGLVQPKNGSQTARAQCGTIIISQDSNLVVQADVRTWTHTMARHASLIFQEYNNVVFEWQTVEQALRWVRAPDDYYSNVVSLFPMLSLPVCQTKYWGKLSGGQKQALALARGLLRDPDILLMDEPFASIDASSRYDLEDVLVKIHALLGKKHRVVILVTHDIDEAVFVANRVLLVNGPPLSVVKEFHVKTPLNARERSFRLSEEFVSTRKEIFDVFFKLPIPST